MVGRLVLAAGAVGMLLAGAGCGGPKILSGCPPCPPRETFAYKPIEIRRAAPPPAAKAPEQARLSVKPPEPPLPPHDPGWEVNVQERPWRWIVIHHSASERGSAAAFDQFHRNGRHWDELGYHFVIGNGTGSSDGEVEVGSRWPKQKYGAHCRVGNNEEYNDFGIGICLVGNFDKGRPTEAQLAALVRLVDYLAARYKIDDSHIIGHSTVGDTRCPGRGLPFDNLFARLHVCREAREALVRAAGSLLEDREIGK